MQLSNAEHILLLSAICCCTAAWVVEGRAHALFCSQKPLDEYPNNDPEYPNMIADVITYMITVDSSHGLLIGEATYAADRHMPLASRGMMISSSATHDCPTKTPSSAHGYARPAALKLPIYKAIPR